MKRTLIASAALYALIALVTFGHAAAQEERRETAEYAECKREAAKRDRICFRSKELAPIVGAISGALWPLYWSWEAQR